MSPYEPSFDFKTLKVQTSIGDVLAIYGLDRGLCRRGEQLWGPCPLHGGDNPTAFRADLNRNIWHCFTGCGGGGDTVELIRRIESCSYREATLHLQAITQGIGCWHPHRRPLDLAPRHPFKPFQRRIPLDPNVDFLQTQKGISVDTAIRFEAGQSATSRFLKGMVAVRLHDLKGRPLGYCGRRLEAEEIDEQGKWRFPSRFPKEQVLYNAHRARSWLFWSIVIVECPWSVMRLSQAGIPNVVALLGTHLSSTHLEWLSQARKVLVMLDGDDAGRAATERIVEQLSGKLDVRVYQLSEGLEPEDLTDPCLKSLALRCLSSQAV